MAPPAGAAGASPASGDGGAFDRRLLAPMMMGAVLNPVNTSVIAVALAPIGLAFGAGPAATAWLVSGLYLATAVGQPLVGRLVDLFGPRRLFLAGAVLTGVAGLLGMFAPHLGVLVAARVVLGFGTCAGYPAAMYLIRSEAERTGMKSPAGVLTVLSITTQTVAVVGPPLGGLLIGFGGWRATFALNIPLSVACLVLGLLYVPAGVRPGGHVQQAQDGARTGLTRTGLSRFDVPGVVLFTVTLVGLLLFLMAPYAGRAWLLGVTALAGAGFAARELRAGDPFVDLRVLAGNLPLVVTYARAFTAATVSYGFVYGYTQWLEDGRGLSASGAGLVLMPSFGVGVAVAALVGRSGRVRGKLVVAALGQLAASAILLLLGPHSAVWLLVAATAVLGLPQGLAALGNQNALYHQALPERMGASAGLLRTFMYCGAMAASAASGAFFGRRATAAGLHGLAVFMLGAAVLFLVLTLADRSLTRVGAGEEDDHARESARDAEAGR